MRAAGAMASDPSVHQSEPPSNTARSLAAGKRVVEVPLRPHQRPRSCNRRPERSARNAQPSRTSLIRARAAWSEIIWLATRSGKYRPTRSTLGIITPVHARGPHTPRADEKTPQRRLQIGGEKRLAEQRPSPRPWRRQARRPSPRQKALSSRRSTKIATRRELAEEAWPGCRRLLHLFPPMNPGFSAALIADTALDRLRRLKAIDCSENRGAPDETSPNWPTTSPTAMNWARHRHAKSSSRVFSAITQAATSGTEVSLPSFGKFKVTDRPARQGRNTRHRRDHPDRRLAQARLRRRQERARQVEQRGQAGCPPRPKPRRRPPRRRRRLSQRRSKEAVLF